MSKLSAINGMQLFTTETQSHRRALVIEPTLLCQGIYSQVLKGLNFEVEIVSNGHDALQRIKSEAFGLIFLAMDLPDTEGSSLCAKLRALPQSMNIPIVMLNSDESDMSSQKALVSGATEVFHTSELKELSTYLEHFISHMGTDQFVYGKILYIEEQLPEAMSTQQLLENEGYEVKHFTNADDAYNELLAGHYDLILTNIMLRGKKTGYTFIREVQKLSGRLSEIPILAISAINNIQRKIELLNSGVSDYIQKPVLDEELLARVQNLVNMRHLLDQVEHQRTEMRELAMHDQLTKLYNRHFLMDIGPKKIQEAQRHNVPISFFMIDLDYFKEINDSFGHAMGDQVLKKVALTLSELCRVEDLCARFGGEEFVMMLSHCDHNNAMNKAELIREAIAVMEIENINITASIGVATLEPNADADFDSLFAAADKAVYMAKEMGRNRIEVERTGKIINSLKKV